MMKLLLIVFPSHHQQGWHVSGAGTREDLLGEYGLLKEMLHCTFYSTGNELRNRSAEMMCMW